MNTVPFQSKWQFHFLALHDMYMKLENMLTYPFRAFSEYLGQTPEFKAEWKNLSRPAPKLEVIQGGADQMSESAAELSSKEDKEVA